MPFEFFAHYLKLPVLALVASRLGGLIMFQPVLGALSVPVRLRALLVVGLAALVTPLLNTNQPAPDTPAAMAIAMGRELLIGVLMGTAAWICFLGLQLGGQLVAQESGLAFGQIADPTSGMDESVLASFYVTLCTVVYLIVGGHRVLVAACLDTFDAIPLLGDHDSVSSGTALIVAALTVGGQVALRVAAPALLTLFMVNIALGFISRTVPQLNIATVGFSLKALIGFVIMAVALPSAATAFTDALEEVLGWLGDLNDEAKADILLFAAR